MPYQVILACLPFLTHAVLKKRAEKFLGSLVASVGLFFVLAAESIVKCVLSCNLLNSSHSKRIEPAQAKLLLEISDPVSALE